MDLSETTLEGGCGFTDLYNSGQADPAEGDTYTITLPAYGFAILEAV